MKNLLFMLLLFAASLSVKSQCTPGVIVPTYTIFNTLSCSVTIIWETTDCCSPVVNYKTNTAVIGPGGQLVLFNSGLDYLWCGSGDICICLIQVDGSNLNPGGTCANSDRVSASAATLNGFTSNGTTASGTIPAGASCAGATTWNMTWTPSSTTIF